MTISTIAVYTDGEVLGDGVIKLQFAGALKNAFPNARLTWICGGKSVYETILSTLAAPLIDEIVYTTGEKPRFKDALAAEPLVPGRAFDLLIDSQHKIKRAFWLKRRIDHRLFISGAGRFVLSERRPGLLGHRPRHMLQQVMQLASLAAENTLSPVPLRIDPVWDQHAAMLLPPGAKPRIGYFPGASLDSKRWPLDRFIALAGQQAAEPVFFLGPAEQNLAEAIAAGLPGALMPLSPALQARLPENARNNPCLTIALARQMAAVVANDSGGGHLAAAAQIPMVSLIRSDTVREKFLPATPRVIGITPQDHAGATMADIPLDVVKDALSRLLA